MKITFKKRRFYKGTFREPGETMEVDDKYARAFMNVNAAVPAVTEAPKKKKDSPVRTTEPTKTETEESPQPIAETPEVEEELKEYEPDLEQLGSAREIAEEEGEEEKKTSLEDMSYRELQIECQERGVPANGTKAELIKRLKEGD